MTPCRRCGQTRKLIKAHAIPEAFFRDARGATSDLLLLSGAGEHLPKMARLGVYDTTILCAECEALFGAIDTYGAQALTSAALDQRFTPTSNGGEIIGYESANLDPLRVLRFLIAVLWRASVSRHPFYQAVNLGPLEPAALCFGLNGGAVASVFDAVLSRWKSAAGDREPKTIIMDPRPERWDGGVRGYRLYLGNVVAYVKVDSRPFMDQSFRDLGLAENPLVMIVARDQAESSDFKAMMRTVFKSHLHEEAFRRARGGVTAHAADLQSTLPTKRGRFAFDGLDVG